MLPGKRFAPPISSFHKPMAVEQAEHPDDLETTEDAFLGGRLTLAQMRRGSRAGIDAIFLAAACPAEPGHRILDLGSGSGIVALAIASRVGGTEVAGIEIDPDLRALALDNAARNSLQARSSFICGDITGPASRLFEAGLAPESFDHAVANPPFLSAGEARLPANESLKRAHALGPGDLERWIKCLAVFVKPGGSATIVHRADALPQLLTYCEGRFGGLTVYPLFPREGTAASRVLVQGRKGSRAPLRILQGIVLHNAGSDYTPEAQNILREGRSLDVMSGK